MSLAQPAATFVDQVLNEDNQLDDDDIFLGFTVCAKVQELLVDGLISPKEHDDFLIAPRAFHVQGTLYALKWLPIDNPIFGRPFVKLFALFCRTVVLSVCLSVCLSCLSVTLVYCGQTVGWIKMKLGMQVGLGPGHIVLDGDPAPRKGAQPPVFSQPPIFGPCPLWPNGWNFRWMD